MSKTEERFYQAIKAYKEFLAGAEVPQTNEKKKVRKARKPITDQFIIQQKYATA